MTVAERTDETKASSRETTVVRLLVADVLLVGIVIGIVLFVAMNNMDMQGSLNGINKKLLPQDSLVVAENAELRVEVAKLRSRVESLQHDNAQLSEKLDVAKMKTALGDAPSSNANSQQPPAVTAIHEGSHPSSFASRGEIAAAFH